MTMSSDGSKSAASKKPSAGKKSSSRRRKDDPPIIQLPLEGKLKRADIRRVVLEILEEKIAANGDS